MRIRAATGVAFSGDTLEWCVVRSRPDGDDIAQQGTAPAGTEPRTPESWAEALGRISADRTAPLAVSWPARDALLRILDLPSQDPAELASMASLQMDKLSPFPPEQMQTAAEILGPGAEASSSRIAAVCLRREPVESLLTAAEQIGWETTHLDLDILVWVHALKDAEAHGAGREIHLRLVPGEVWMLVLTQGQPDLLRVFAGPFTGPEELRTDMAQALTGLGMERGESLTGQPVLWSDDEEGGRWLSEALPTGFPAPVHRRKNETEALCRQCGKRALEGRGRVELLPPAWADRQRRRKQNRMLLRAGATLLAVWLFAIAGMTLAMRIQQARLQREEAAIAGIEEPAADVRALMDRTRSLQDYADRSRSAAEVLRETSRLLPNGVTLTQFSYTKGRGVTLAGEAAEAEPIYEYLGRLESSDLFASVRPENVTSRGEGGAAVSQFRANAELRAGPSS